MEAWELLIRMVGTAVVVIVITWAVGALGPVIGGALAGFPITLGPGFFFLAIQETPEFFIHAASFALLALCATQVFLLIYMMAARRFGVVVSIASALAAWFVLVLGFAALSVPALVGGMAFVVTTLTCRVWGKKYLLPLTTVKRKSRPVLLILRGVVAGVLVAVVTSLSELLGSYISGVLLASPIGYTVMAITIHQEFGDRIVIQTLHAMMIGTVSLGVFCFSLAIGGQYTGQMVAFLIGLVAATGTTAGLSIRARYRKNT